MLFFGKKAAHFDSGRGKYKEILEVMENASSVDVRGLWDFADAASALLKVMKRSEALVSSLIFHLYLSMYFYV